MCFLKNKVKVEKLNKQIFIFKKFNKKLKLLRKALETKLIKSFEYSKTV
jgi:hypothetical protein